jgi:hypothetical protein
VKIKLSIERFSHENTCAGIRLLRSCNDIIGCHKNIGPKHKLFACRDLSKQHRGDFLLQCSRVLQPHSLQHLLRRKFDCDLQSAFGQHFYRRHNDYGHLYRHGLRPEHELLHIYRDSAAGHQLCSQLFANSMPEQHCGDLLHEHTGVLRASGHGQQLPWLDSGLRAALRLFLCAQHD